METVHSGGSRETVLADVMRRMRVEFVEMPEMRLTLEEASRLWHLDRDLCEAALSALVDTRFLVKTRTHRFARA